MSEVITDEMKKTFAKNLLELIERKGITRKRLAEDIGVSDAIINFYISGDRYPRVKIMGRLCDYFGVDLRYMVTDHTKDKASDLAMMPRTSYQSRIQRIEDEFSPEEIEQILNLFDLIRNKKNE